MAHANLQSFLWLLPGGLGQQQGGCSFLCTGQTRPMVSLNETGQKCLKPCCPWKSVLYPVAKAGPAFRAQYKLLGTKPSWLTYL